MKTEKKATHTPGPWLFEITDGSIEVFTTRKDTPYVALVHESISTIENACLIAAAPDLLEAAKEALSDLYKEDSKAASALERAIAKAEGK